MLKIAIELGVGSGTVQRIKREIEEGRPFDGAEAAAQRDNSDTEAVTQRLSLRRGICPDEYMTTSASAPERIRLRQIGAATT